MSPRHHPRLHALLVGAALLGGVRCTPRAPTGHASPPLDGASITDPVDGSTCAKTPASESAVWEARTYYFCADGTAAVFRKTPEKYGDRR